MFPAALVEAVDLFLPMSSTDQLAPRPQDLEALPEDPQGLDLEQPWPHEKEAHAPEPPRTAPHKTIWNSAQPPP